MSARGFRGEDDLSVTLCVTAPLGGEPRERRLDFCRESLSASGFRGENDLSVTFCVTAPPGRGAEGATAGLLSGELVRERLPRGGRPLSHVLRDSPLGGESRERRLDFCREGMSARGFRGEDDLSGTLCVTAPLGGEPRMGLPSCSVKKGKNGFIPPGFRGRY